MKTLDKKYLSFNWTRRKNGKKSISKVEYMEYIVFKHKVFSGKGNSVITKGNLSYDAFKKIKRIFSI